MVQMLEPRRMMSELQGQQKARGFLKPKDSSQSEERKQAVAKKKLRTRCAACGKIEGGPRPSFKGRGGGKNSKGKGSGSSKAYFVADQPVLFSLDADVGDEDQFCNMVNEDLENDRRMEQDSGYTDLDDRRKAE